MHASITCILPRLYSSLGHCSLMFLKIALPTVITPDQTPSSSDLDRRSTGDPNWQARCLWCWRSRKAKACLDRRCPYSERWVSETPQIPAGSSVYTCSFRMSPLGLLAPIQSSGPGCEASPILRCCSDVTPMRRPSHMT